MAHKKTALFLCKCGANIAGFLDMDALAAWGKEQDGIEAVEVHDLLCSPNGKQFFLESIKNKGYERIVIGGCSPKMHEKTFQDLCEESGINMGNVQMANIREHCAWVTADKSAATQKAESLLKAATRRAWQAEILERRSMTVNTDLLVIGGGIAGIEAALMAAKADRKVTIVEKEVSLGGNIIKSEEVAPNMECAPCLLAPRLAEVKESPNIEVITNAEVTSVVGFYGNFTAKIVKKARAIEDSCIGCEACFEVCPAETKSAFHLNMGKRKAIYTLFPGSVPAAAAIDKAVCKHFVDNSCDACVAACPFESINFDQADEAIEVEVGAIVVATGFKSASPAVLKQLGHPKIKNVFTLPQFERMVSSNGPFGGEIKLSNRKKPKSVAVIHCAGSLRKDGVDYCSRVCCIGAVKVGELVRKQMPDASVVNIHNDLVFAGPHEHAFLAAQIKEGTTMVKCEDLSSLKVATTAKGIQVRGKGFKAITVDMVVLSTGMLPAEGSEALAKMLNIDNEPSGFFKADHALLHQTGASLDGIYIAGCAMGPSGVAESVTQAQAAAGDALSKLVTGRKIELEAMTSVIDEERCAGCKLCISVCPYKAVSYDAEKKVCIITEAICRGCGTCTATCPSGASKARHFTDEQIYAEIGGILND